MEYVIKEIDDDMINTYLKDVIKCKLLKVEDKIKVIRTFIDSQNINEV